MDYAYLKEDLEIKEEEHGASVKPRTSMTVLMMQETMCGSVWSYAVESKGAADTWVAEQIADDLGTVGMAQERIILKSDQ